MSIDSKEYGKQWYRKNRKRRIKQIKDYKLRRRKFLRKKLLEYFHKHPCVDCGEKDIVILEFDHVRGKKKYNISSMIGRGYAWEKIKHEIKKCEVVCCNCHRKRTFKRSDCYRLYSSIGRAIAL